MTISCPKCTGNWTKSLEVRRVEGGEVLRRRKQCLHDDCKHLFTTYEVGAATFKALPRNVYDMDKVGAAVLTITAFVRAIQSIPKEPKP